jgi:hypothetical protein
MSAIFVYLHFPSAWKKDHGNQEILLANSPSDIRKKKRLEEKKERYGQHVLASFGPNDFDV